MIPATGQAPWKAYRLAFKRLILFDFVLLHVGLHVYNRLPRPEVSSALSVRVPQGEPGPMPDPRLGYISRGLFLDRDFVAGYRAPIFLARLFLFSPAPLIVGINSSRYARSLYSPNRSVDRRGNFLRGTLENYTGTRVFLYLPPEFRSGYFPARRRGSTVESRARCKIHCLRSWRGNKGEKRKANGGGGNFRVRPSRSLCLRPTVCKKAGPARTG